MHLEIFLNNAFIYDLIMMKFLNLQNMLGRVTSASRL